MASSEPRMTGQGAAHRRHDAPDFDKYELRLEAVPARNPRGTPVPYSTDGDARPRRVPHHSLACAPDWTSRHTEKHDFIDGQCWRCGAYDPREWPEVAS